jgi:hypothetical protein
MHNYFAETTINNSQVFWIFPSISNEVWDEQEGKKWFSQNDGLVSMYGFM